MSLLNEAIFTYFYYKYLQLRILILMFAHSRVTRGNESIFQFKVYGSVSYPRKYCNIYDSIIDNIGNAQGIGNKITVNFTCVRIFRRNVWFVHAIGLFYFLWHTQTIRFRRNVRTQLKSAVLICTLRVRF